jgi:hypothetical protein
MLVIRQLVLGEQHKERIKKPGSLWQRPTAQALGRLSVSVCGVALKLLTFGTLQILSQMPYADTLFGL